MINESWLRMTLKKKWGFFNLQLLATTKARRSVGYIPLS